MVFSPVAHESLGDRVAHELRVSIINGVLHRETHLVEDVLAEQFGVSRGPIRDALRQLEAEGLVESRRRGVVVTGLSEHDVDELYTLRESLESLALTLAMERAQPAEWSRAQDCVDAMAAAADRADAHAFAQADLQFHAQFYQLSGHRRLMAVWEQYRPTFSVILDVTNAQDVDLHPSAQAHADLLHRARARDRDIAVTTLTEHLLGARNRLRSALRSVQQAHGGNEN